MMGGFSRVLAIICATCALLPPYVQAEDTRSIKPTYSNKIPNNPTGGLENRLALVIGNSKYAFSPLKNPLNDARAMVKMLEGLGFNVIKGENLSRDQMGDKIFEFGERLQRERGVGLFYFAGHGVQVSGKNYLIPIGANISHEKQVAFQAIEIDSVLAEMEEARNRLNILILDACRNNPFARSFRSTVQGLASIDAPVGTFIAYATAPGSTAGDGDGKNGRYTEELIRWMGEPGLQIEDVFKRVLTSVKEKSNGVQIPWISSSLEGDFYFSVPGSLAKQPAGTYDLASTDVTEPEVLLTDLPAGDEKAVASGPIIIKSPKQAEKVRNEGFTYYQGKQYDKAIETLSKAIELGPGDHYAYFYRGACYSALKDYKKAVNDFDKAIELNPSFYYSYVNKGVALTELKDYDGAVESFTRALKLDSTNSTAYFNRGITYVYSKKYESALADFDQVLKLDPTNRDVRNHAEYLREKLKRYR